MDYATGSFDIKKTENATDKDFTAAVRDMQRELESDTHLPTIETYETDDHGLLTVNKATIEIADPDGSKIDLSNSLQLLLHIARKHHCYIEGQAQLLYEGAPFSDLMIVAVHRYTIDVGEAFAVDFVKECMRADIAAAERKLGNHVKKTIQKQKK